MALVFTGVWAYTASAENNEAKNYEKFFAEEDILNARKFSANERDDYAGVYVDGATIVLLFKNDSIGLHEALKKCEKKNGVLIDGEKRLGSPIIVKSAVYRNSELRSVQDLLFENIGSVGLLTLGLNNKNNCIDVGISSNVSQEQVEKKLYDMIRTEIGLENRPGHDMLSFEIIPEEKRISYVTSIDAGTE